MVAHAAVRGIHIEELESELEGDIDLRGFLGLADDVPRGFTDIRVKFRVKADVDNMDRLKRLTEYSPVFNTITQGANVDIQVVLRCTPTDAVRCKFPDMEAPPKRSVPSAPL